MVSGIALVERGRGELPAAVVAQDPLLLRGRQRRIGHGHVEPAGAVARVRPGAVVGRERDEGPMNAGVGTTSSRPSGMGASPRCSTNVRARSISRAYAPTSAAPSRWAA